MMNSICNKLAKPFVWSFVKIRDLRERYIPHVSLSTKIAITTIFSSAQVYIKGTYLRACSERPFTKYGITSCGDGNDFIELMELLTLTGMLVLAQVYDVRERD